MPFQTATVVAIGLLNSERLGTDNSQVRFPVAGGAGIDDAVGQSVPHACVQALFLEETAELQLMARAAGFAPRFYTQEGAARRHGDDRVHEPVRAWDYYVAAAEGGLNGNP